MRLVGLGIILFFLVGYIVISGGISNIITFINFPSIIVCIGATLGSFFIIAGTNIKQCFRAGLLIENNVNDLQFSLSAFRGPRLIVIASGFALCGFGIISMFENIDYKYAIGPGMSAIHLGLAYAIFIAYFILLPLEAGIEYRLVEKKLINKPVTGNTIDILVLAGVFFFTGLSLLLLIANPILK